MQVVALILPDNLRPAWKQVSGNNSSEWWKRFPNTHVAVSSSDMRQADLQSLISVHERFSVPHRALHVCVVSHVVMRARRWTRIWIKYRPGQATPVPSFLCCEPSPSASAPGHWTEIRTCHDSMTRGSVSLKYNDLEFWISSVSKIWYTNET